MGGARPSSAPPGEGWDRRAGKARSLVCALAAALIGLAHGAWADTISEAPQSVGVTIYRDRPVRTADLLDMSADDERGLALITETRTVDLPAGRTRLRFEGVADGIIPQSAAVEGLPGGAVERNFDYDLLTPGSLIARLIDQKVRIVRTDRKTGKATSQEAVLRSGPQGVVLQTADGIEALRCSGGPEKLVFDHAPEGLADRPTLSVVTDTPRAGRYTLRVSYLSVRLDWSADYVARLRPDGKSLDLTGWITLANRSRISFPDAPTAVVAGRLARQPVDLPRVEPETVALNCWPLGTTHHGATEPPPSQIQPRPPVELEGRLYAMAPMAARATDMVAADKRVEQTDLGDYKLYSLVEPTTVAARQTKQVQFLHQPQVRFQRVYRYAVMDGFSSDDVQPTAVLLKLDNKVADGLGAPLPAGSVSVRQPQPGDDQREMFVGAAPMRDVPLNEPFELQIGRTREVAVQQQVVEARRLGSGTRSRVRTTYAVTGVNHKAEAAMLEVRFPARQGLKITDETARHGLKAGDPLWRLPLAAGATTVLTYTAEFDD